MPPLLANLDASCLDINMSLHVIYSQALHFIFVVYWEYLLENEVTRERRQ